MLHGAPCSEYFTPKHYAHPSSPGALALTCSKVGLRVTSEVPASHV